MGIKLYSDTVSKTKLLPKESKRILHLQLLMRRFETKNRKACKDISKFKLDRYTRWCREIADIYEPIFRENRCLYENPIQERRYICEKSF